MKLRNTNAILCSVFALASCVLSACNNGESPVAKWEYKETERIKSPDLLVDAVIVTGTGGATTSNFTWVSLVPSGAPVKMGNDNESNFIADHLKNFKVVWKSTKLLDIQYEEARIFKFSNYWQNREVQDFHYVVELKLDPASSDFSLPIKDRTW